MKYILSEWQQSDLQGSSLFASYYDDQKDSISFVELGKADDSDYINAGLAFLDNKTFQLNRPTLPVVERSRALLEQIILQMLQGAEQRRISNPMKVEVGDKVELKEHHRNQKKSKTKCYKCDGTGKWINPQNPKDSRDCYICDGSGWRKTTEKVRDEKGKIVYEQLPAGMWGIVVETKSFGRNPSPEEITVFFRTLDGEVYQSPLSKLKLRGYIPDTDALIHRAREMSYNFQFGILSPRYTVDLRNYAKEVYR